MDRILMRTVPCAVAAETAVPRIPKQRSTPASRAGLSFAEEALAWPKSSIERPTVLL